MVHSIQKSFSLFNVIDGFALPIEFGNRFFYNRGICFIYNHVKS